MEKYNKNDIFCEYLLENLQIRRDKQLEAIAAFEKKKKREVGLILTIKNQSIKDQIADSMNLRKNKMMIELNDSESSSVKHIAVKSNTSIKCTTRFMSGKLLLFAKLSWKSFIYSLIELLTFPEENAIVQKTYTKYNIERIYVYHVLTNTDSTSLQFVVVSSVDSDILEDQLRDILFEIFSNTEIRERFDKSDKFWEKFGVHNPQNQKKLSLYEVESINDPCLVTLAVNPKEYFEYFESENINKKHKGIKKRICRDGLREFC